MLVSIVFGAGGTPLNETMPTTVPVASGGSAGVAADAALAGGAGLLSIVAGVLTAASGLHPAKPNSIADITASTSASEITTDVLDCIAQLAESSVASGSVVLNAVAWSGTQFVAVGLGGVVETSPDGITWTNRGSAFATSLSASDLRGVVWQNNRFLAVGVNGGSENCSGGSAACPGAILARQDSIMSSTDGITWTSSVSTGSLAGLPDNSELNGIVWDGSEFVAVGDQIDGTGSEVGDFGHVLLSTDGLNWSATTQYGTSNSAGAMPALTAVTWSGAQFVAVGDGILPSANGNAWTVNSLTGNYTGVASSGTIFVATGLSGALYSSPDGQNWTQHAVTSLDLYGVAWSGEQFVAVGAGIILTSHDGLTWTTRSAGTSSHLYGVTWSGTQFVAVGAGAIVTSPDGATWTSQSVN